MKKIKEYRMSLMEKDDTFPTKEEGKSNFIIRNTAMLEVERYIVKKKLSLNEEEYDDFVLNSSKLIYDALVEKKGKYSVDTIGIWIKFADGKEVENSIELSVLEDLQKYGMEDVVPVFEFIKMTVQDES